MADDAPAKWGDWPKWGDQGDGTYRNPVIPSDYSDIDCIRVGADYYAVSSTFQFSPGFVIFALQRPRELVDLWGMSFQTLGSSEPDMTWTKMNRYGSGIWAGAIRFHDNKFWVYFLHARRGLFYVVGKRSCRPVGTAP